MDSNFRKPLDYSFTLDKKITPSFFRRSPEEEKALQIIKDIKSKKIQLRPKTESHTQICNILKEARDRYDKNRPMFHSLNRAIIQAYNDAEFYGLIEKSESGETADLKNTINEKNKEIEELKNTINEKNKKIADLQKSISRFEGNDKPEDYVFTSEAEEKHDD